MVAVSLSAILIRFSDSHPLVMGAYRQTFATLLFVPPLLRDRGREVHRLPGRRLAVMVAIGVVLGCHFAAFISAVTMTSVAAAVLLATCHPLFVAPVGWLLYRECVSRRAMLGMVLAFAGVVVLLGGDLRANPGYFDGNMLALAAGILAGIYFLGGRGQRRSVSLPTYALVVYASSAVTLWVMVLAGGHTWRNPPPRELLLFALMALVPTLLGHTLHNWALGYLPAYAVSVTLLAEPVGSGLLAWLIFNDWPGLAVIIGGAMVLAGIWHAVKPVASADENALPSASSPG